MRGLLSYYRMRGTVFLFFLFSSGLFINCLSTKAGEQRAVCIGIAEYPGPPERSLRGPDKDAGKMAKLLVSQFGFKPENITTLTNHQATFAKVTEAIETQLIDQSTPEDVVVITYTGHGGMTRDSNNDEHDGIDECLIMYDHDHRNPETWFTDDHFSDLLARLKTDRVLVIIDACHSGTVTRSIRKLPYENFFDPECLYFPANRSVLSEKDQFRDDRAPPNPWILTSCAPNEVSLGLPLNGEWGGLFSGHMRNFLSSPEAKSATISDARRALTTSVISVIDEHKQKGLDPKHNQTPQFSGNDGVSLGELLATESTYGRSIQRMTPSGPTTITSGGAAKEVSIPPAPPASFDGGDIDVEIVTDKDHYRIGESVKVTIKTSESCYGLLCYQQADGTVIQIWPNRYEPLNVIPGTGVINVLTGKAGGEVVIPGKAAPYQLKFTPPTGGEYLFAIVSSKGFNVDLNKFGTDDFMVWPISGKSFEEVKTRGLAIVAGESKVGYSTEFIQISK